MALSAVIGGTVEVIGGGKFANGAISGVYIMMLNHMGNDRPLGQGDYPGLSASNTEMPNVLDYKNGETVSHTGTDYVLHNNQWLELMSIEQYQLYLENWKRPSRGGVPWSREGRTIFEYDQKYTAIGGVIGASGISSKRIIQSVIEKGWKFTPADIIAGWVAGRFGAYYAMYKRMKAHDVRVDHLRKRTN